MNWSSLYRNSRRCWSWIFVSLCLVTVASPRVPADDTNGESSNFETQIEELAAQFRSAYQRRASDPFQKAINELNANYVSALRQELVTGPAHRKKAVEAEIAVVEEKGNALSPRASDTAQVRKLRSIYGENRRKFQKAHDEEKQSLLNSYEAALKRFQPLARTQQDADLLNEEQQKVREFKSSHDLLFAEVAPSPASSRIGPKPHPLPPLRDGATRVVLEDFPRVQQKPNWCGQACATMLAQHFGRWVDQSTFGQLASIYGDRRAGTSNQDLVIALKKLGFEARLIDLNSLNKSRSRTEVKHAICTEYFETIKREIDAGRPFIFRYETPTNQHYEIIIGYQTEGDHHAVIRRNPLFPTRDTITPVGELANLWAWKDGNGYSVHGLILLEGPPVMPIVEVPFGRGRVPSEGVAAFAPILELASQHSLEELTAGKLSEISKATGIDYLKRADLLADERSESSAQANKFTKSTAINVLVAEVSAGRPGIALCQTKEGEELRWVIEYDQLAKTLTYRSKSLGSEEMTVSFDDFADDWVRKNAESDRITEIIYVAFSSD